MRNPSLPNDIEAVIAIAIAEDLGMGDLTADLIDPATTARAEVVAREHALLCGTPWFDEVFNQIGHGVQVEWHAHDGDALAAGTRVCTLAGPARALLSGERTALNFLQTLSGTATATRAYVDAVAGTAAKILDTRKTLPGLRSAQKYAVRIAGGHNHRSGLFDAVLIKENHIAAAGGITAAAAQAREKFEGVMIEIEVESIEELAEALDTDIDRIMLDEFSEQDLRDSVQRRDAHTGKRKELEASGSVDHDSLRAIAATGVDFISIGALTKHLRAIDFSMRIVAARI